MTREEDSFNAYINQARVTVEMAFGRLKGRWRRLLKTVGVKVAFSPTIIAACCTLHNVVEMREGSFRKEWLKLSDEEKKLNKIYPQPEDEIYDDNLECETEVSEAEKIRNALKNPSQKISPKN